MIRRGPAGVACAALLLLGSSADLVGQDPRIAPVLEAADLPWALDPSGWYGFENLAVLDASSSYAVPHRMLFVAWTASTMAIGRVVRRARALHALVDLLDHGLCGAAEGTGENADRARRFMRDWRTACVNDPAAR